MAKKTIELDANGKRKFGMRDCLAYAAGDFGCNMSFALKGTMAIFWTQAMHMDSLLYAALLVVLQIWDAINDPLIGSIIDNDKRTTYKRGKFLAYIWAGSLGLLVAGALCFVPWFENSHDLVKGIIFVAGYIIWDAFYTVANVPYGSLLSLISSDTADRASLSAWRSVGSMVGNMVPMILLPNLIYDANQNIIPEIVFIVALVMGAAGFVSFQFMIRNTEIRVEENISVSEEQEKFNVIKAMGNFLRNRPAVGATIAAMGMFIGMQAASTAVTVMFQSYFKNVALSGIVSAFAMIPIVVFTPLARKLVVKYGKKELSIVGSICSMIACTLMLIAPITPNITGLVIYIVCQLINSLGMGIYSTVSWSMMGDAIDYNEWKFGVREEGTVYSLHSFFRKLAQGVGPAMALVIMKLFLGYSEINGGNQLFSVALNMRYFVAALYLLAAVMQFVGLALVYNLDKNTLAKMSADLGRNVESDDVMVYTSAEDNDNLVNN